MEEILSAKKLYRFIQNNDSHFFLILSHPLNLILTYDFGNNKSDKYVISSDGYYEWAPIQRIMPNYF